MGQGWIADYSKLKCEGGLNPVCGTAGCTLQIYFWDGETAWDMVFEDLVQSYKFGKSGGKPMLYVTTSGCSLQQAGGGDLQIHLSSGKGRRGARSNSRAGTARS